MKRGGGEEEGRRRDNKFGMQELLYSFHTREQKFMIEFGQHSTVQSISSHRMNVNSSPGMYTPQVT